jgi:hypothetical protein
MILTHESGAQEDQFDGKKRRPNFSWYYPFNTVYTPRHQGAPRNPPPKEVHIALPGTKEHRKPPPKEVHIMLLGTKEHRATPAKGSTHYAPRHQGAPCNPAKGSTHYAPRHQGAPCNLHQRKYTLRSSAPRSTSQPPPKEAHTTFHSTKEHAQHSFRQRKNTQDSLPLGSITIKSPPKKHSKHFLAPGRMHNTHRCKEAHEKLPGTK